MNICDNATLPKNKRKKYNLIPLEDTSKFLSSAYLCIKDFFKVLRGSQELIYKIITKLEPKNLNDSSFLYFITNNFFDNILSSKTYSEEFLLLITHLLYDQITALKKIEDFNKLFEKSIVFTLLKYIKYKKDVHTFFRIIFKEIIEEYEYSEFNMRPLYFKIDDLAEFIKNEETSLMNELNNSENDKKKEIEKKQKNEIQEQNKMFKMKISNSMDNSLSSSTINFGNENENENDVSMNEDCSFDGKKFLSKYIIELNKKDLINILNKESNEIMKNFIREQLERMKDQEKFYGNSIFLDETQKSDDIEKILYNYQKNFYIVIDILSKIIKKLNDNLEIIPYNIKYICKLIIISLKKQFENITNIEIYKSVSEFFFIFIFQEFFLSPDYGSLITSIIISDITKKNLSIIFGIWKRFISLKLYTNNKEFGNFTPFNWFFLDNIQSIFNIYEKLIDFNLPDSLMEYERKSSIKDSFNDNSYIINTLPKNTSFYSYSICYNINNLTTLLNIIKNNISFIFENKKIKNEVAEFEIIYKNIKDKKDIFKQLKNDDGGETINYYIYNEVFYSKKFQDILFRTIKQGDILKIKEIKNQKNEDDKNLNKIIRIKNLLCEFLFKSENLDKLKSNIKCTDFNNIIEIISSLSKYYKQKATLYKCFSSNSIVDLDIDYNDTYVDTSYCIDTFSEGLPLEWYANTLLYCFQEIIKGNNPINYYEIFQSLKEELNNSINKYNFGDLAQALKSLKNTRHYINNYIENQENYKNLNLNTEIRNFIENEKIEVEIKFRYDKEIKIMNINRTEEGINSKFKKLDEFLNEDRKDDAINCSNILEFIKKFPPLSLYSKMLKIDVFLIEKEIRVKRSLLNFLKIVKEHITIRFGKNDTEEVYSKVKKIIMTRLYDKLFPKKPDLEDNNFYRKCRILSWVEPKHLKLENLFFDNFLPKTSAYFEQINNEKSASGKLEIISKIFDVINNVIIFNKGGNFSTDDIAPICEYALIKAQPDRLSSNLKYLQIFMKKDEDLKERMYFDYLKAYMNIIKNANYSDFNDIKEEEFIRKCNQMENKLLEEEFDI